jgi:hypothetical protein
MALEVATVGGAGCLGRIGDFGIAKSLNKRERERDGIESSGLPLGKLTLTNVKR